MIHDRGCDWCISVSVSGVFRRSTAGCGEHIINDDTIGHLQKMFAKDGSDAWWMYDVRIDAGYKCPHCGGTIPQGKRHHGRLRVRQRQRPSGLLKHDPDLDYPCEMYLEGSDQHRGWFNSSLLTSVAVNGYVRIIGPDPRLYRRRRSRR